MKRFIEQTDIPFAVVVDINSWNISFYGELKSVGEPALVDSLFGDKEAVQRLHQSVAGGMLPKIWSQGKTTCWVCMPSSDLLVGLFGQSDVLDAVAEYELGNKLNSALIEFVAENEEA